MRKLILAAALALGGCSTAETFLGTDVTPTQVYVAANTFVAAEASATQYLRLPNCPVTTGICKTPAGVSAIVPAIRGARQAVAQMEAYVDANPGSVVPISLYSAATAAISGLQSALAAYNVKG